MTKVHFESLATFLRDHGKYPVELMEHGKYVSIHQIADWCTTQNPRFDRDRFLAHCLILERSKP